MSTYYADNVWNKDYPASNVPTGMVISVKGTYTVPAGGLAANDVVQMVNVPSGAIILDVVFASSDVVTASSTTLGDVGDGDQIDRYIDGQDLKSAAFISSLAADGDTANDGVGYEYTAADTIDVKFLVDTTDAANVYTLVVTYMMAQ